MNFSFCQDKNGISLYSKSLLLNPSEIEVTLLR
jgi:hypothetical protein